MSELLAALPDDIERAARALLDLACERDIAIVTAESCTRGLLASLLTHVEGASRAFERGFVVYTDEAKCELLAIEPEIVKGCGAVSAKTAAAMAHGGELVPREEHFGDIGRGPVRLAALRVALGLLTAAARAHASI